MKRPLDQVASSSSEGKKHRFCPDMDPETFKNIMQEMSKTVTDNITANLGATLNDLTTRMTNVESNTRILPPAQPPVIDLSLSQTPVHQSASQGRGRSSNGRGRSHSVSASESSASSSGGRGRGKGRGRGRGGSTGKKRKNEYITGMKRDEFEKMMSNVVLNYDTSKEIAAREIILKGMATGNDVETATTHIKLIDPQFTSFEIEDVQRFSKADASGVPPLKVTLKRKAMASRLIDLLELAGEDGAPWASPSLPFLVRQKNRLVLQDIDDLNSNLPVNPSKHWEKKKVGGHVIKKYKPNPKFNINAVAPALQNIPGSSLVTAEAARLAMANMNKVVKESGPSGATPIPNPSGVTPGVTPNPLGATPDPSGTSQETPSDHVVDMEQDEEDPSIENWTPEYRAKIMKLLEDDSESPTKTKDPVTKEKSPRPTRGAKKGPK